MRQLRIGPRLVTDDGPAYLCADLSHNHLGEYHLAAEMIAAAAEAGADCVKLQKRGPSTYDGLRQIGEHDYAHLRENRELTENEYARLLAVARKRHVDFSVTPFDVESAEMLARIGVDVVKIASGDVTNLPLLRYVATLGKPILLSTGGCDLEDVARAHEELTEAGAAFALLHCTSEYPVAWAKDVNLRMITTLRDAFPDTLIGFSSHVRRQWGPTAEVAAYTLGARVFETHFTLTPAIGTGEHGFGRDAESLHELVEQLTFISRALGDGKKQVLRAEETGRLRLGKHLVYSRPLAVGHQMVETDFAVVGGGRGIPPHVVSALVGGRLSRSVVAQESVEVGDILSEGRDD